jgi:zinc protease
MRGLYGDKHPYGRSLYGTPQTLSKVSSQKLHSFHKKLLGQPQVLSVVGAITPEQVLMQLETMKLRSIPKRSSLQKNTGMKTLRKDVVFRDSLPKEQTHLYWGIATCSMDSPDRHALLGLSALLSGQGGRLFVELRDKKSLCYTVAPTHMEGLAGGHFAFYIATSPEKESEAVSSLKAEVQRLIDGDLTESEWERARSFFVGNAIIENQRLSGQALNLGLEQLYGHGFEEAFRFEERLKAVNHKDLIRVARHYFGKSGWVTAVVAPKTHSKTKRR